jgi:3-hydroxy-3-methylglutaryl CoA synthase
MKKMEVYSQSLTEKLQEIARRKKERERIEEERKAREEYKLYLKLKEKYEGKDT